MRATVLDGLVTGALAGAIVTSAGCSSTAEPAGGWYAGSVVARDLSISIGDPPSVHVKAAPSDECGIIFLVRSSTRIRREGGMLTASASYADLTVGTSVRVLARVVLDSCPGQSAADVIEIQRAPQSSLGT